MEFWRYYRIIRRRRWLILLGMVVCVGFVAYSNRTTVQQFRGRTTVMESKGTSQQSVPLFPEQFMQTDVQLRLSNLGTIATSQKVLANAESTLSDLGLSFTGREILAYLNVEPERDTSILAIEVTLPSRMLSTDASKVDAEERTSAEAKIAADVISAELRKVYAELNNSSVRQSREFIEVQLVVTKRALLKAQNALQKFQEENEVVELNRQAVSAVDRLQQMKMSITQSKASLDVALAREAKTQAELKQLPIWETVNQTTTRDPKWERLNTQLTELQNAKAAMITTKPGESSRGPKHPDVLQINRQIGEVSRELLETQQQYIAQKGEAKNPTYQQTLNQWISAKVDVESAKAGFAAMSQQISDVRSEMAAFPAQQAKYSELMSDVAAAGQTYTLMRSKLDEAKIKEQQAKNEVSLKTIDPAYVEPVNKKELMKIVFALILSPLLGIGAAFLLHYTDNTIKTASEAEVLLGMPVLCAVPENRAHSLPRQRCPEIVDVAYQMLTSNIWIASQNQDLNAIVVVSAEPNVGRSVTASNLAVSLAREGARVVLVDADLRQPTQHLIFGVDNKVGLSNVLSGAATLEDALAPTKVQGLLLIPTGPIPENPVKMLRAAEMRELDEQVKSVADFVIYDTPAGVTFPDPVLVAAQVGSAIVVHSAGRVPRGSESDLTARLQSIGVNILGAVLNNVKREDSSSYFHYRRSYQGVVTAQLPGRKKTKTGV